VPYLDLKGKRAELYALQLALDARTLSAAERDELQAELAASLTDWLPAVWRVAGEARADFALAHACLLRCAHVLEDMADVRGGCRCAFGALFVPVRIVRASGALVRAFELDGAHQAERVLLWIWRELLLALLASSRPRAHALAVEVLEDIEDVLGWRGVERVLYGGADGTVHNSVHKCILIKRRHVRARGRGRRVDRRL
jgi:hypothetical protein